MTVCVEHAVGQYCGDRTVAVRCVQVLDSSFRTCAGARKVLGQVPSVPHRDAECQEQLGILGVVVDLRERVKGQVRVRKAGPEIRRAEDPRAPAP